VTRSVDPKEQAVWSLSALYDLLGEYLYEIYDTIQHTALGQSPQEAYLSGLAASGQRAQRQIAYDQAFLIWTLPTTPKGTAKVCPGRGVKLNHVFYWSDALRDPSIEGEQVEVRYDPFDIGIAYAFVSKRWVRCISEYYSSLKGTSERELMLATVELRKRAQNHAGQFGVTAKKLAEFLASIEGEEILRVQRKRDREAKDAPKIAGGADVEVSCHPGTTEKQDQPDVIEELTTAAVVDAAGKDLAPYEEY